MASDTVWCDDANKTAFVIESSSDDDGVIIVVQHEMTNIHLTKKEALKYAHILIEHIVNQGVY